MAYRRLTGVVRSAVKMEACWANAISACRGPISGEHIFTRGLFQSKFIDVAGFPWLKGAKKTLSIDSLTVNRLCAGHNSDLSEVDQAAIDAFNVFREVAGLGDRRAKQRRRSVVLPEITYRVDGVGLERWLLKSAINLHFAIPQEVPDWAPPPVMVEAPFGKRQLDGGAGLGIVVSVGQRIRSEDSVSFGFLYEAGTRSRIGAMAAFRGYLFVGTWSTPVEKLRPGGVRFADERTPLLRPKRFHREDANLRVEFDWSGNYASKPDRKVAKLRQTYKSPRR